MNAYCSKSCLRCEINIEKLIMKDKGMTMTPTIFLLLYLFKRNTKKKKIKRRYIIKVRKLVTSGNAHEIKN